MSRLNIMYPFITPKYKGKNVVNLMSSITKSFGAKHDYIELNKLKSKELNKYKNIVLLVVDGLGYNYLNKQKKSFLKEKTRTSITSTFLSTTACANSTLLIGYPPQQHALTGWDINLKETGTITTVLPFFPKYGGMTLDEMYFDMKDIVDKKSVHKNFKGDCFTFIHKDLAYSAFTNYVSQYTKVVPTTSYTNAFTKIKKLVKTKSRKRRLIHTYISDYDATAHKEGTNGKTVTKIFWDLDKKIKNLFVSLKGTNTLIIVIADHGFTNTKKSECLWSDKIPGFKECLTIPLAGEPRVPYCYVRPSKVKEFEKIVKTKLSKYCWAYKGEQIIKDNLYGLGKPSKKLFDRVGDYVLVMKGSYVMKDLLSNYNKRHCAKGNHGGVTEDEMLVPLVLINC